METAKLIAENHRLSVENNNLVRLLQAQAAESGGKKNNMMTHFFQHDIATTPKAKPQRRGFTKRRESENESDHKKWKEDQESCRGDKPIGE